MSTAESSPFPFLARRTPPLRIVIACGGTVRAFHLRPWAAGAAALAGLVFALFYFTATGYLVFRDDLLAASLARQARLQQAYEDRIASLRSDIDRLTSRQLLNQEAFEARLERLFGRQAALDARQDIIAGLSQAARGAGLLAPDAAEAAPAAQPAADAETDTLTTGSIAPAGESRAPLAVAMLRTDTSGDPLPASDQTTRIVAVESSLDDLARDQVSYVEEMASDVAERSEKIASILARLGYVTRDEAMDEEAVGGPFLPLDDNADPETFRASVALVTGQIDRFTLLRRTAGRLPLAKPIANAAITSRFGARLDPFLRRPAMHTGVDFKAPIGYPARASAAGTVITAGYTGGYGYMVEVDHGGGVTSRYAHLSRVLAREGDIVARGAIVGRTGTTGRSTGPHLHYEVRVDGRAIDPMSYIRAGAELSAML
jgi:murein DD-endopeptidase MepM/ murein hydrolase activator NlpD